MAAPAPKTLALEVRDYECDLQGIVNNAVYLHYFEHARHQFLKAHGLDFDALNQAGVHLVVVRAEVDYKAPLKSGDRFTVVSRLQEKTPVRFQFLQEIHRAGDTRLMVQGTFDCAAMDRHGKPIIPRLLAPLFHHKE